MAVRLPARRRQAPVALGTDNVKTQNADEYQATTHSATVLCFVEPLRPPKKGTLRRLMVIDGPHQFTEWVKNSPSVSAL